MARPLRLEHPGAIWHVTARGNAREPIFLNDGDRLAFLDILDRVVGTFRWFIHAWVLMENHFHLVVETPEPTLSRGMRQLNGIYTQRFNARHARVGHLLQGRFKAVVVERQAHLLELARYVVLNPVRAGVVGDAQAWPWSSYRATAGVEPAPSWLSTSWLLASFDDSSPRRAQKRYSAFVAEGIEGSYRPWEQVIGQLYLGGGEFVAETAGKLVPPSASHEYPKAQRAAGHAGLAELVAAVAAEFSTSVDAIRTVKRGPARKALAYVGRVDLALKLRELAPLLGITEWSISNLAAAGERLASTDTGFRSRVDAVRVRLATPPKSR